MIYIIESKHLNRTRHHLKQRYGHHRPDCKMMKHIKCSPPIYTYGPCYKACSSPSKILYVCPNGKRIESYVYEKRVNGRCAKFPLKTKHTENCTIRYVWKKSESKISRKKRSVQLDTTSVSKCGKNQHYVPERNPCPETCEGKFFGVESKCSYPTSGPGCECLPGYMRDGVLCVPPSQCGCLESVCVDRESAEKCKRWRAEGRCQKDRAIMQRFCKATCQRCERPCEDQIASSQCELIKRRGECNVDFYKSMCMLTCSPQNCKCPKCYMESGQCHPITKNIELRHICYQLQSNGSCKPLITRRYRPCGECPIKVTRIPGKCNYCTGFRKISLHTYFREEFGFKRCLKIERSHKEKCCKCVDPYQERSYVKRSTCDRINLALKTCQANKIPVIKTMVRVQTSCDKCIYKKVNIFSKPIVSSQADNCDYCECTLTLKTENNF
ncbi:von Willebrand factor type A domain-containing protein [Schistosoma japonicum]|nr:von Willebrand factor type A domain-containing protein [Schistosoma japonicum]